VAALVGSVAADAVLAVLLAAGLGHLLWPAALRSALVAHGVLPAPGVITLAVPVAEVGIGVLGGYGLVLGDRPAGRGLLAVALAGACLVLVAYAAYSWRVLASGRAAPCGCSRRDDLPMSGWVVGRAAALAVFAALGLALTGSVLPVRTWDSELATVLLAAAVFGLLLWQLPAAMHDPTADRRGVTT
jgi:hypothetical protein